MSPWERWMECMRSSSGFEPPRAGSRRVKPDFVNVRYGRLEHFAANRVRGVARTVSMAGRPGWRVGFGHRMAGFGVVEGVVVGWFGVVAVRWLRGRLLVGLLVVLALVA